ncbi:S1 family serine peptidase [Photobacterium aphoticum]|nr:serine protease [Photobacterium aphoticum]PSU60295.1 serine protease [Photobacterium aphoticum]GHA34691.1 hypothetical protein GCM10007086_05310 [Photobacterium aphoticum]
MDNPQITFRPHLLALSLALPAVAFSGFATAEMPASADVHSSKAASTLNTKVMNGEPASSVANDLLPWQAAIMSEEVYGGYYSGCGAVIISDYWAVTAAHCLESYAQLGNTLIAGTTYIPNSTGEANTVDEKFKFNIVEKIKHPGFNGIYDLDDDIGLIKVDRPLSSVAKPIKLATPDEQALANQDFVNTWTPTAATNGNVIASGWGNTEPDFLPPNELMVVKLAGIPLDQCDEGDLPLTGSSHFVCADSNIPDVKKDVCAGDSGGPLIWQNPNNAGDTDHGLRVIGVTSYGPYCDEKYIGNPLAQTNGLYTELAAYYDWIALETQLNLPGLATSSFTHNPFDLVSEDATNPDAGTGNGGGEGSGNGDGNGESGKETESSTTSKSSGGGSMPLGLLASLMALAFWRRQLG